MVDCGDVRCAQERRNFKKELLSWTKKVPVVLGLEEIAKQMDQSNHISEILKPFNDLENTTPSDWEPQQECSFCDSRARSGRDVLLPKGGNDSQENGESLETGFQYLQEMLPLAYNSFKMSPYNSNPDQPLDLSLKGNACVSTNTSQSKEGSDIEDSASFRAELKVPLIKVSNSKKKENGRRSYTEKELMSAVCDIKSGKIGTRRASVLYGIPRSTLRNKIFRMDNNVRPASLSRKKPTLPKQADLNRVTFGHMMNGLMENAFSLSGRPGLDEAEEDKLWEQKLQQIRYKHNLDGHDEPRSRSLFEKKKAGKSILPDLVKKLAKEHTNCLDGQAEPLDLFSSHTASHYSMLGSCDAPQGESVPSSVDVSSSNSSDFENIDNDDVVNVSPGGAEIKVPSFTPSKAMNGGDASEMIGTSALDDIANTNSTISETLRNIIAKTIADKVRARLDEEHQKSAGKPGRDTKPSDYKISKYESPTKRSRPSKSDRNSDSQDATPMSFIQTKKTRPKRGQYRKYNSQLLIEAVRAVQRGEMSVHRAGSYFGVPHSTLEYKVKERHLLRQKKVAAQKESGFLETTDSPISTMPSTDTDKLLLPNTPPKLTTHTDGMVHSSSQSFSGFAVTTHTDGMVHSSSQGFAVTTPASELLRRLQQKVQANIVNGSSMEAALPTPDHRESPSTSRVAVTPAVDG